MARLLAATNVTLAILVLVLELRCYRQMTGGGRWVKLLYTLVGAYWAVIYFIIFLEEPKDPGWFGQIYIRPAFTFTLAVIAAGAIWRIRSLSGKRK